MRAREDEGERVGVVGQRWKVREPKGYDNLVNPGLKTYKNPLFNG